MSTDNYEHRLHMKLQPEEIVGNLLRMGVALILYELLKPQVLDQVRSFYMRGFDESGYLYDEAAFDSKVRQLDPESLFRASLLWLQSSGAIDSDDVGIANRLGEYRHRLAHENVSLIVDPDFDVDDELIDKARKVLHKVSLFWAHVDTNPAFEGREVNDDDIQALDVMAFDRIHSIERAWQQQLNQMRPDARRPDPGNGGAA